MTAKVLSVFDGAMDLVYTVLKKGVATVFVVALITAVITAGLVATLFAVL